MGLRFVADDLQSTGGHPVGDRARSGLARRARILGAVGRHARAADRRKPASARSLLNDAGRAGLELWSARASRTGCLRLAVFVGGWSLEAVQGVCADDRWASHELLTLFWRDWSTHPWCRSRIGMDARAIVCEAGAPVRSRPARRRGELEVVRRDPLPEFFLAYAEAIRIWVGRAVGPRTSRSSEAESHCRFAGSKTPAESGPQVVALQVEREVRGPTARPTQIQIGQS